MDVGREGHPELAVDGNRTNRPVPQFTFQPARQARMLIASKSLLRFSSTGPIGVEAEALTGGSRGVALGRIKRLPARDVLETAGCRSRWPVAYDRLRLFPVGVAATLARCLW